MDTFLRFCASLAVSQLASVHAIATCCKATTTKEHSRVKKVAACWYVCESVGKVWGQQWALMLGICNRAQLARIVFAKFVRRQHLGSNHHE